MPAVTEGAFRLGFFFSFLGRIVSELGFVRILPLPPAPPTATWGMEVTVSVSTVIVRVDPSPDGFPRPVPKVFTAGAPGRDVVVFSLISPLPPLSLPLSFAGWVVAGTLPEEASRLAWPSNAFRMPFPSCSIVLSSRLWAGELTWLTSCTVSSVEVVVLLAPRAGVLMPGGGNSRSSSLSLILCLPSTCSIGCDGRRALNGSCWSVLRGDGLAGLWIGGGDLSLGDVGQRGVSLDSGGCEGFCGTGALMVGSERLGYKVGMDEVVSALWEAAAKGGLLALAIDARDGLTSLELFFRDRVVVVVVVVEGRVGRIGGFCLAAGRTGEGSREGIGELVAERPLLGCSLVIV